MLSGRSPPSGWSTITIGSPTAPSDFTSLSASPWNAVVAMSPAAVPAFATSTASWRLHDVQDPQSPEPANTMSHRFASSATRSGAAGVAAFAFLRWTISRTP